MRSIAIGACAALAMASCAGGDESPGTEPIVSVAQAQAPEAAAPAGAAPTRAQHGACRPAPSTSSAPSSSMPRASRRRWRRRRCSCRAAGRRRAASCWASEYMCTNGYNFIGRPLRPTAAASITSSARAMGRRTTTTAAEHARLPARDLHEACGSTSKAWCSAGAPARGHSISAARRGSAARACTAEPVRRRPRWARCAHGSRPARSCLRSRSRRRHARLGRGRRHIFADAHERRRRHADDGVR